ncbi:hypothetical protein MRX96_041757 [Rhipicephalus microplus]
MDNFYQCIRILTIGRARNWRFGLDDAVSSFSLSVPVLGEEGGVSCSHEEDDEGEEVDDEVVLPSSLSWTSCREDDNMAALEHVVVGSTGLELLGVAPLFAIRPEGTGAAQLSGRDVGVGFPALPVVWEPLAA